MAAERGVWFPCIRSHHALQRSRGVMAAERNGRLKRVAAISLASTEPRRDGRGETPPARPEFFLPCRFNGAAA